MLFYDEKLFYSGTFFKFMGGGRRLTAKPSLATAYARNRLIDFSGEWPSSVCVVCCTWLCGAVICILTPK